MMLQNGSSRASLASHRPLFRAHHQACRQPFHCRAAVAEAPTAGGSRMRTPPPTTDTLVSVLKQAAEKPGAVPSSEIVRSMVALEKSKTKLPTDWFKAISAPNKRWRLVFTAGSKAVQAAAKGKPANGAYFPLTACQKFGDDATFENGIFLGPVGHLTFKGPCTSLGKQLSFDVHTMYLGLGPWRVGIPLKKDGKPLAELPSSEVRKLPFFLYAFIDEDIIVARGRSGGLALWAAADPKWQASAGVLQVFK